MKNICKKTYRSIVDMFQNRIRIGAVQPMGSGKSFLFLKWIEDNQKDAFCIFSPSNEIFSQLHHYAEESGYPEILQSVRMITYQALLVSISADRNKERHLQAFREDNSPDAIKLLFTVCVKIALIN